MWCVKQKAAYEMRVSDWISEVCCSDLVLAAHIEGRQSGEGQGVDAARVDGANLLMSAIYGLKAAGHWEGGRGNNVLDGGAPWYSVYETADGKFGSVAAIEPQFRSEEHTSELQSLMRISYAVFSLKKKQLETIPS